MDIGDALRGLKRGKKIAREGWNGKGMHLYLLATHSVEYESTETEPEHEVEFAPCIVMFTAQGTHQPGWLASQPDLLAEDWVFVD